MNSNHSPCLNFFKLVALIAFIFTFPVSAYAALCSSSGQYSSYEWINNIQIGSYSHASGNNNGYADFAPTQTIPLKPGAHNLSLTPGFSYGSYPEYWSIWIDLNQDEILDSSELVFSGNSSSTVNGAITIPSSALPGKTIMRVAMKYGSSPTPCEIFTWGEVEDYTVDISSEPSVPTLYTINVDNNYVLSRTGELGDSITWQIEKDGVIVLSRNASSEMTYNYFNNTIGSKFRVWLAVGGQQASNIVEYEAGKVVSTHELTVDATYKISRSGYLNEPLTWVIEKDGIQVLRRYAANELSYTYFNNMNNSYYRVWLEQFVNGAYEIVSNVVHYVPGIAVNSYNATLANNYDLIRDGSLGDPVNWVLEENGVEILQQDASTSLFYNYPGLMAGSKYRAWLVQMVNGQQTAVSNVLEFTPGPSFGTYSLSIDASHRLYRSGSLGDNVIWVIEKNGTVVLQRNAANELDYLYYSNTSGSSFRVWLQQFSGTGYYRVSDIVEYDIP